MTSLFRNLFRSTPAAADCIAAFLRQPEHRWILTDEPFRNCLIELLCGFPIADLNRILREEKLLLLYSNQKMSCALYGYEKRAIVLIFPELRDLMHSVQYHQAHAILAHELGHIYHRHARVRISPIDAQLQADRYAMERGFGEELLAVLRAEAPSQEVKTRILALERELPGVHCA